MRDCPKKRTTHQTIAIYQRNTSTAELNQLNILRPFPSNFEFSVLDEMPSPNRIPIIYFPGNESGQDGPMIEVVSDSISWIGMFAFGDLGISIVSTTPNPDEICVISRGDGFIVNTRGPEHGKRLT